MFPKVSDESGSTSPATTRWDPRRTVASTRWFLLVATRSLEILVTHRRRTHVVVRYWRHLAMESFALVELTFASCVALCSLASRREILALICSVCPWRAVSKKSYHYVHFLTTEARSVYALQPGVMAQWPERRKEKAYHPTAWAPFSAQVRFRRCSHQLLQGGNGLTGTGWKSVIRSWVWMISHVKIWILWSSLNHVRVEKL